MSRLLLAVVVTLSSLPRGVAAQDEPPEPRAGPNAIVHYGKWATAAAAIGFTVLAAREHEEANRNWQQLLALCRNDNAFCQMRGDGRYADYQAELLYQRTLYYDHRARRRLIAGQVSLLTTAALFILDLRRQRDDPKNIPLHGLELRLEPVGDGARAGLRLRF